MRTTSFAPPPFLKVNVSLAWGESNLILDFDCMAGVTSFRHTSRKTKSPRSPGPDPASGAGRVILFVPSVAFVFRTSITIPFTIALNGLMMKVLAVKLPFRTPSTYGFSYANEPTESSSP